jgi:hypothetical protein
MEAISEAFDLINQSDCRNWIQHVEKFKLKATRLEQFIS